MSKRLLSTAGKALLDSPAHWRFRVSIMRHRNEAIQLRDELTRRHAKDSIERVKLIAVLDVVRRYAPTLRPDLVILVAADAICARTRATWLVKLIGPGPQELQHPDDVAGVDGADGWGHADLGGGT